MACSCLPPSRPVGPPTGIAGGGSSPIPSCQALLGAPTSRRHRSPQGTRVRPNLHTARDKKTAEKKFSKAFFCELPISCGVTSPQIPTPWRARLHRSCLHQQMGEVVWGFRSVRTVSRETQETARETRALHGEPMPWRARLRCVLLFG